MHLSQFNRYIEREKDLAIYNINSSAAIVIEDTNRDEFISNFDKFVDIEQMREL